MLRKMNCSESRPFFFFLLYITVLIVELFRHIVINGPVVLTLGQRTLFWTNVSERSHRTEPYGRSFVNFSIKWFSALPVVSCTCIKVSIIYL